MDIFVWKEFSLGKENESESWGITRLWQPQNWVGTLHSTTQGRRGSKARSCLVCPKPVAKGVWSPRTKPWWKVHNNTQIALTYHLLYSVNRLVWHDGIPEDEIWLKVGGDKGGGSFKMNFQIVNVAHPNSPENTCVFCIYEASDTLTNLHISLDRYRSQVNNLESQIWR